MRSNDWKGERPGHDDTAIIRRMRARRRIRIESGDMIVFDVAAFRVDRSLGASEHAAVENNLRVIPRWPEVIYDSI